MHAAGPLHLALLLPLLAAPAGCSPVGMAVGAGAGVGVAAASEKGVDGTARDLAIRARINDLWFRHDIEMFQKVGLSVTDGRVVLTGAVQKPEHRVDAVRLAWQAKGVQAVINEIQVTGGASLANAVTDAWITTQLNGVLLLDRNVTALNFAVDTVNGVVYVMGIARDRAELDRVINHARNIRYVNRVVSHARLADPAAARGGG